MLLHTLNQETTVVNYAPAIAIGGIHCGIETKQDSFLHGDVLRNDGNEL